MALRADGPFLGRLGWFVAGGMLAVDLGVCLWFSYQDWPEPWRRLLGEQNAVTWLSSVQLVICSWMAMTIAVLQRYFRHGWADYVAWAIVGVGFGYLALDEWFEIHEHISLTIPFVGQTDEGWLLLLGAVFGVTVGPSLWRQLRAAPKLLIGFALSVGLAIVSQALDSVFVGGATEGVGHKLIEVSEEIGELMAQAGFAGSLVAIAAHQLLASLSHARDTAMDA